METQWWSYSPVFGQFHLGFSQISRMGSPKQLSEWFDVNVAHIFRGIANWETYPPEPEHLFDGHRQVTCQGYQHWACADHTRPETWQRHFGFSSSSSSSSSYMIHISSWDPSQLQAAKARPNCVVLLRLVTVQPVGRLVVLPPLGDGSLQEGARKHTWYFEILNHESSNLWVKHFSGKQKVNSLCNYWFRRSSTSTLTYSCDKKSNSNATHPNPINSGFGKKQVSVGQLILPQLPAPSRCEGPNLCI